MKNDSFNKTKAKITKMKFEFLLLNIALFILGLLMVMFPTGFNNMICIAIGIGLCIWGIIRIVSYVSTKKEEIFGSFGLVQGCAMIGFGTYFLVHPDIFAKIVGAAIAITLLVTAVVKIQYAFDFLKLETKYWWIHFIGALIMALCGIFAFIKPFGTANLIMMFMGISLLFSSLWDIITVVYIFRSLSKKMSKNSGEYINIPKEDISDD